MQDNQERISAFASALGTPALNLLRSVGTGLVGAVTIFVLSFLAVLEGPKLVEGTLALFPRGVPSAFAASPATAPRP